MKILVVDDDRLNLRVAEDYLKMYFPGTSQQLCDKPQLVMDILAKGDVDIILLDIMMPQINGIDLLKEIRTKSENKEIQILMLTSLTDTESFRKCFELGANDYLKKPIDKTEFLARVNASINTRKHSLMLKELYKAIKVQNDELKQINAQLKNTQFHLIQSEKLAAIGELAAGVAHEINNPIGYVGSNLETILNYLRKMKDYIEFSSEQLLSLQYPISKNVFDNIKMSINERYKSDKIPFVLNDIDDVIKDSRDGIQRVSEIIKALRNFARTGFENEKNYYQVSDIIQQVLIIVHNEAKNSVEFRLKLFEGSEVYCNNGQISQVLLNIVINGIQAVKSQNRTEKGLIEIEVYEDNRFICIGIKDDGPGIPEENLSKIFNPFYTTKEVGQGTGLGLSISHEIVEKRHGGILDVKSRIGEGAEFIIKLPLKKRELEVSCEKNTVC